MAGGACAAGYGIRCFKAFSYIINMEIPIVSLIYVCGNVQDAA